MLNPVQVELELAGAEARIYYRRKPFPRTDVVIPRIGLSVNQYGMAVVNHLQLRGIPVLNGAPAIAASRNKMRCLQLLAAHGVQVPATVMASDPSGLRDMVKLVGGVPVLVKLLSSDKGGVMICESLESLEAAIEAIRSLGQNIIVQQYLRGAHGRDLRALVVAGRVVAAMRRRPQVGQFARTLRPGAKFQAAELPAAYVRAAVEAARIVGLEVCAVDMLDVKGGPRVFEVNSSPSIREPEEVCGVDVATAVVSRALELAQGRSRRAANI